MTNITIKGNYEGSNLAATKKGIAIMVDVLRASTTIPTAMDKGIAEFYIAKEVEDTRLASKELGTLLVGERDCLKLPGFNFGNSPVEMSQITNFPKNTAAFTSSTGARRVVEAIGAKNIIIGSIINAQAIASYITSSFTKQNIVVVIIPAFTEGSIISNEITEDQIGALLIAREFQKHGIILDKEIKEEIVFLEKILEKETLTTVLTNTKHGQKLVNLNFEADIAFCAKENQLNIVPISQNEVVTLSNNSKIVKIKKKRVD
jgi:2-phosphosulfolactate phosphatase